jgi:plastocyanin
MHTHLISRRRNPVLLIVSLLVIAGLACSLGGGGAATDTPAPANTQAPATEVVAAPTEPPAPEGVTVTIEIGDNTFTPATLEWPATVIWTHAGAPHSDGRRRHVRQRHGETAAFEFTFDTAATIAYHCEFHGGQAGRACRRLTVGAAARPRRPRRRRPVVVTAAFDIAAAVDQFRALLGRTMAVAGRRSNGRRGINWDVPDEFSAPLPGRFFNATEAPRARGILLTTPGTGLQVSAGPDNPTGTPLRFGNINPTYPDIFKTFSPEKLFTTLGSNLIDLTFFVPGTQTPALVRGYGAVYTDSDTDHTSFEYRADGSSLGKFPCRANAPCRLKRGACRPLWRGARGVSAVASARTTTPPTMWR